MKDIARIIRRNNYAIIMPIWSNKTDLATDASLAGANATMSRSLNLAAIDYEAAEIQKIVPMHLQMLVALLNFRSNDLVLHWTPYLYIRFYSAH